MHAIKQENNVFIWFMLVFMLYEFNDWATGWTVQGSNPNMDKKFFSSPKHPDQLWASLLFSGH
jgi:hypothetical protein